MTFFFMISIMFSQTIFTRRAQSIPTFVATFSKSTLLTFAIFIRFTFPTPFFFNTIFCDVLNPLYHTLFDTLYILLYNLIF